MHVLAAFMLDNMSACTTKPVTGLGPKLSMPCCIFYSSLTDLYMPEISLPNLLAWYTYHQHDGLH